MKNLKVYIAKDNTDEVMIYDHHNQCACWGEDFYYVSFEAIKKYWVLIGEY